MTPKQMYRAMRKWGISVVWSKPREEWLAGDCLHVNAFLVNARNPHVPHALHVGTTPESAVEDYCNARNLEWDV